MVPLALVILPLALAGAREEGLASLEKEQWEEAARLLGQARVEDPADPAVTSALATALHRAGRYREAEQMFRTLAAEDDAPRQAIGYYNAGNSAYADGRLDDAKTYFDEALKRAPEFESAKKNAEATAREIQARLNPQEQQQQQDQQGDQQPQDQQGQPQDQQGDPQQQDQQGDPQQQDQQGEPQQQPGDQDPEGDPPQETEGEPQIDEERPGSMTEEQAARVVDSVPEGKPRVRVQGRPSGKDW